MLKRGLGTIAMMNEIDDRHPIQMMDGASIRQQR